MTPDLQLVMIAAALVIGYGYLSARLAAFMQPLRLELAEIGEELLSDPDVPAHFKASLQRNLDEAFHAWAAWRLVLAFPVAMISIMRTRPAPDPLCNLPVETRRKVMFALRVGTISMLANSPLAAFLFALETILFLFLFLPIGRAGREAFRLATTEVHPSRWFNGGHKEA